MQFKEGEWYRYVGFGADENLFKYGHIYQVLRYTSRKSQLDNDVIFRDAQGTDHPWCESLAKANFEGPLDITIAVSSGGAKYDSGKLLFRPLIGGLAKALHVVAAVLTYGAKKYAEDSWQEVPDGKRRYENALYRHQNDRARGEQFDEESGLLHSAHIATNALFVLWFEIKEYIAGGNNYEDLTRFNDPTRNP